MIRQTEGPRNRNYKKEPLKAIELSSVEQEKVLECVGYNVPVTRLLFTCERDYV